MLKADAQTVQTGRSSGRIGAVLGLSCAVGFTVVRFANGAANPIAGRAELWLLDDVAIFLALAVPALLALIAARGRPQLFLAAGIVSLLLGLSPIVYTLPLLIPAVLFLVAYARSARPATTARTIGTLSAICLLSLFPVVFLFVGPSATACWSYRTFEDGSTRFSEDRTAAERHESTGVFSQSSGPPRPGEVESGGGCTDGVIGPRQSIPMIASAAAALLIGRRVRES